MIVILKQEADKEKKAVLKGKLKALGFDIHESKGRETELWGLVGDTSIIDDDYLRANEVVEDVKRVQEPYKMANRKMHPEDTVIDIRGRKIGGGHFQVIAGPVLHRIQRADHRGGGGCEKERSRFAAGRRIQTENVAIFFSGTSEQRTEAAAEAKAATGLPVVTEIMTPEHLELFEDIDVVQVGRAICRIFSCSKRWANATRQFF